MKTTQTAHRSEVQAHQTGDHRESAKSGPEGKHGTLSNNDESQLQLQFNPNETLMNET